MTEASQPHLCKAELLKLNNVTRLCPNTGISTASWLCTFMPVLGVQSQETVLMPVLGHSLVTLFSLRSSALHIHACIGCAKP